MEISVFNDKNGMGTAAAEATAAAIRAAIAERGESFIIVATGASQFEMLKSLVQFTDIDWSRVTAFHLDEYVGISESHPASFRKYLKDRFVAKLPGINEFHYISGEGNPQAECDRVGALISACTIDVACVGIGENGHLAFNDPPADFDTEVPYIVVDLDEDCRKQQLGEGWFPTLADVPVQAISMSIRQIMKARHIVCTVPDERKAQAVRNTLENEISNLSPASIMREHADCHLFIDTQAASLLSDRGAAHRRG